LSIITKIFVVLQLVGSLALAVIVVMYVSNQEKYKPLVATSQNQLVAAQAALTAEQAQSAALREDGNKMRAAFETEKASLQREIDNRGAKMTDLASQIEQLTQDKTQSSINVANLSDTTKSLEQQLTGKDTELGDLRPKIIDLTAKNADLNRRLNTEVQKNELADKTIRELQEAVAAEDQKSSTPASGPGASSGAGESGPSVLTGGVAGGAPTPVTVNGTVKETKDVNGKTYVSLSLGSRDGVRIGTRLTVYRNNSYVADVVLTQVNANESVGVVTITKPGNQVSANDLVISGPSL
jgi:hypothetical protein